MGATSEIGSGCDVTMAAMRLVFEFPGRRASRSPFHKAPSKREDIGSCIRFNAFELLRRHVLKCPENRSFLCQRIGSGRKCVTLSWGFESVAVLARPKSTNFGRAGHSFTGDYGR